MWEGAWGPRPPLGLGCSSASCLPARYHPLTEVPLCWPCVGTGATGPTPSPGDASLFGVWGLLEHILRAHAPTSPHLSLLTWQLLCGKPSPPHCPILGANAPFPFKILLKHLPLAAYPPPPPHLLDIHPPLLVCVAVAMFIELLEAKVGGCVLTAKVPPCPQTRPSFRYCSPVSVLKKLTV